MKSHPFPPGSQVCAYLRDSGGERQDQSVERQETAARQWCSEQGLVLTQIFRDEARPGSSTVGRDGFQAMMRHFRTRDCPERGLVIWNYQRFARDVDDAQYFRADLRRRGFTLHSLNDDIPDGPMGRLFEAALDWKNEQFLLDLSTDVKDGLKNLVIRYGAVPGTPPTGFRREPVSIGQRRDGREHRVHKWAPDPELVPLIRQSFEMKLAGRSLSEINRATHLFGSLNSYTTFFRNPLYKGQLRYGDLVIDDYCDPLVDPQTWDRVQALLEKHARHRNLSGDNPRHPRRTTSTYLLSGLAYCALCGSPLSGLTSKFKRGDIYERYECSRAKRRRDCTFKPIPRLFLEATVIDTIREFVLEPGNLYAHQLELTATQFARQADLDARRSQLRTSLGSVRRSTTRITNAIAEAGHSRALLGKLKALELEEADLLAQISDLERQAASPLEPLSEAQIQESAERLSSLLASEDPDTIRTVLRGITHKIVVERDGTMVRGSITYYYPPELPNTHDPPEFMSLCRAPLGAPIHRHIFSIHLATPITRKKRSP